VQQVNDAGLHQGSWKGGVDRLGAAFQPVVNEMHNRGVSFVFGAAASARGGVGSAFAHRDSLECAALSGHLRKKRWAAVRSHLAVKRTHGGAGVVDRSTQIPAPSDQNYLSSKMAALELDHHHRPAPPKPPPILLPGHRQAKTCDGAS
jgi:hypothetical protein